MAISEGIQKQLMFQKSNKLKLVHKRWSFGAETVFFMILRIASKRAMFTPLGATNFQLFGPGTFKQHLIIIPSFH